VNEPVKAPVNAPVNAKVYIHELIDIRGQQRARYMHHMLANWSPIGQEERAQLCFGVWGTVGSTGRWPEVVNIWEHDGFDGLADSFAVEFDSPTLQDPKLAKWWAEAANYRRGGFDRILVPAPWMPTIEQLCARGVHGAVFAHETYDVARGTAGEFLAAVEDQSVEVRERFGWTICGAWQTAMADDSECILIWAIPTWRDWAAVERVEARAGAFACWRTAPAALIARRRRFLMVDAPLSPMRTGRQPTRADRESGWADL
jgi:hypothetical protein